MSQQEQPPVGKVHKQEQPRDAIHFALACLRAGDKLAPGQSVWVDNMQEAKALKTPDQPRIGIVDPFLPHDVYPGEWIYIFLNPGSITSLRHEWTHPQLGASKSLKEQSTEWMRNFADEVDMGMRSLLEAAESFLAGGEHVTLGFDTPDIAYDMDTFWKHYEIITGKTVVLNDDQKEGMFSCAC